MKSAEEQLVEGLELDDDMVMHYLLQHPGFFIRNSRLVEQMHIPHPVRGSVSLVEWQLTRQRNQIKQLEEEITLLMEQVGLNEVLFKRLLQLQADLTVASSLQDMLDRLQRWAQSFGLAGASIRLFSDSWKIGVPLDFTHLALSRSAFETVRIQRLGCEQHYLGSLNSSELLMLLPQVKQVGSVALSLLGEDGSLGVIIFSSRDSQHYQQGMGTLILNHLARLLPVLLMRWVEPA